MPQLPGEEPKSQRSVLQILGDKTGLPAKVLLPDSNSEHGASPVVSPGTPAAKLVPQGRGNYQLLGEIARGGMGVILKGHDTDLGRDVAVKVLDGKLAQRPEVVQRFIEEAQIGGQLQHPGIVPVYELGLMADDCPYFTMKLVKGHTLAALFKQRKTPAENRGRLLAIFESVCQTVAYAHSKSVLHRDLKPANVMVGAFGEVQVVDWGLAKVLRRGGVADEKRAQETVHTVIETVRSGPGSSGSDSMAGSVMGTPAYMAPEQAQGEIEMLDERADVFSLGAILCELLTGKPPYVEIEGETLVLQAARAKLQPARARIEACDADPVLKQLCLECLMPSREVRPANAEEVAKAVHAFLTSTEERAQKAELEAAEARIKAAEERRARRLTLALGGVIGLALLLGGGGLWWIGKERTRRNEQTRTAVEAAYGESIEFEQAGKPEEALASARRALSLAETGGAEAALLERARNFVAKAELDVGAAERERTLAAQDEKLRARLVELRLAQIATIGDPQREIELDAAFTQAFHDYGVDLEGDDLVPALKRIRERKISEEVALALDDWGRLRRRVHGAKSEKAENLFYLAMDLDPDALRKRMREAIAGKDLGVMLDLTSAANLPKLEPGSIFVLTAALWDGYPEQRITIYRILEQALQLYPGDYVLQSVAGFIYTQGGRYEAALACRRSALSLRPNDLNARVKVADSLQSLGRLTDTVSTLRACLEKEPTNPEANYNLGLVQTLLGDFQGALASHSRSPQIASNPNWQSDLWAAQFYSGVLARDEFEARLAMESAPNNLLTYLFALVDHPDPKQRDPELVLRTLEERAAQLRDLRWPDVIEAIARVRLEDWPGAYAALDGRFKLPFFMILSPMAYDFLRSLICSHIGHTDEARGYYQRGMAEWDDQTSADPAAWEHSDAMRWRREAEAVLAKK
ncbi:MAG: protein kinase [Planctomycetes bacterium]|nr:protein kinase [Planctomycetota bacterium]